MDVSRNYLFIDSDLQQKLANTRIFVCGLGIGSVFSELAVRTGVNHLLIADGDQVDASNLNRQNYTQAGVGQQKTVMTAQNLRSINPDLDLQVIDHFCGEKDFLQWFPQSDFVINTIDFDAEEFIACSNLARECRRVELFPINLGFGCAVFFMDPQAPTFTDFFQQRQGGGSMKQRILEHLLHSQKLSPYLYQKAQNYFQGQRPSYDPQLGISTYLVSTLMMTLILKSLNGDPMHNFPHCYYMDCQDPTIF